MATLSNFLKLKIFVGTKVCTNEYPSYLEICENLVHKHKVVNHSIRFVADDGTHTNNIESFWSHLKYQMRQEIGVTCKKFDFLINETTF